LALLSTLARRTPEIPRWVGPLGLVLGVFLVITWLARLIVLDATSMLVLGPALVSGLLSPIFFLLLGAWLLGWRR
jgi:amino acid permease